MGRAPCCEKVGLNKGKWTEEEDQKLVSYIKANGEGSWRSLPKNAGLLRCGKSCRLRWINYLRDDLKRGNISPEEEDTIIKLQASLGNRWSLIATHLPGRTDNEIKNHWNSHLSRRIQSENPPVRKKRGRKPKSTTTTKNEKPIKKTKKSTPKEDINTNNIQSQEQQQMVQVSTTTTSASTTTCCNTPETSGETSSVEKPAGGGGSSNEEDRIDLDIGDLEGLLLGGNLWKEVNGDLWPAGIWEENEMIIDCQPNNLECNNGGCDPLEGDENLEKWLQSSDFFINDLFL